MERFLASAHFKYFNQRKQRARRGKKKKHPYGSKYNSISDRICTTDASYFEKLIEELFKIYNKELQEETALPKVDSTYITLAAKPSSRDENGIKVMLYMTMTLATLLIVYKKLTR